MALLHKMTIVTTTTLLTLLLPLPLPLTHSFASEAEAAPTHAWRYVFPFFPEELDILLGHLRTTVYRLEEVLEQCEEMIEGEWEGDDSPIGVMRLSAPEDDDNGNGDDESMEEKVERILELRETISGLEDKIEECRFHFWTGSEAD